jgi:hypothetical protein
MRLAAGSEGGRAMSTRTHERIGTAFVAALVLAASAPASRAADTPAWEKALLARSDALNRYYGLGKYAGARTKSLRQSAMPAWKRALIARSDALNRYYKLGKYADR